MDAASVYQHANASELSLQGYLEAVRQMEADAREAIPFKTSACSHDQGAIKQPVRFDSVHRMKDLC